MNDSNYNPYQPKDMATGNATTKQSVPTKNIGSFYSPEPDFGEGGSKKKIIIAAIIVIFVVAILFIGLKQLSKSSKPPVSSSPKTNSTDYVIDQVYGKSNVPFSTLSNAIVNYTDHQNAINATYKGYVNLSASIISIDVKLDFNILKLGKELLINGTAGLPGLTTSNSTRFYLLKNGTKNTVCLDNFSNSNDFNCVKLNSTQIKNNSTDLSEVSGLSSTGNLSADFTFDGIKNTTYENQKCYLIRLNNKTINVTNSTGTYITKYSGSSCISYKNGLPLYFNMNIIEDTSDITINVNANIKLVSYNKNVSASSLDLPKNVTFISMSNLIGNLIGINNVTTTPQPIIINTTNTTNSTFINVSSTPIINSTSNCSEFNFSSDYYPSHYNYTCRFVGGFMNVSEGAGDSGYVSVTTIGENNKTYYQESTDNGCIGYMKSFYAPPGNYTVKIDLGRGGGYCGNATVEIT